jgi:mannose-6-phosphate isomerase
MSDVEKGLRALFERRMAWLTQSALPLWAQAGVDPRGGFFERIDQHGRPVPDLPRRARVVARQTYVFATATEHGWGDYSALIEHGAAALFGRCLRDDGLALSTYAPDGTALDCEFDGYDQAFVLFALATIARTRPDRRKEASAAGIRLLSAMQADFRHPAIGFEEAVPRRTPLLQNPHMHLLEACLAFDAVPGAAPIWRAQAGELVELAATRLIDANTGAIHEYFDGDWRPVIDERGGVVEPGHQFEWAWLLWQWSDRVGDPRAAAMAARLYSIGHDHGCAPSGQVLDVLNAELLPRRRTSRLWPQTERLKACLTATRHSERAAALEGAAKALVSLDPYFATPVAGLWYDRLDATGAAVDDAAPASSLYHVVCALDYAQRQLRHLTDY